MTASAAISSANGPRPEPRTMATSGSNSVTRRTSAAARSRVAARVAVDCWLMPRIIPAGARVAATEYSHQRFGKLHSMPRIRVLVVLLLLSTFFLASAQQVEGRLAEVRVEGTTNYADIVRTLIISRPGTAVDTIDLEAERNRVYSLGTFETVTVEFETTAAGPVLVVRVRENPRIGEIEFEGVNVIPEATLVDALRSTNLLEPGR